MLARRDAAEHVRHHQHHRQQQVGPDDGQLRDRDAREGGGDEPHHEPERTDDQLGRRAPVGGPVERPHPVAEHAAEEPAEEEPHEHARHDDPRPRPVAPGLREPVLQGEGGADLVGAESADQGEDDAAHDDQHGGSAPRPR